VIGVVGLGADRRPDILLTPDERRLLDSLMDQTAVAIERVRLAKDMDEARVAAEAERLRGALLTSLSHDLKTPLASIVGAATSLCDYGERLDAKGRLELAKTIEEEGARMTRFVGNLLDMTRLEAGSVQLTREPTDISEIIGTAMHRTEKLLKDFKVRMDIETDLPLLELDQMLTEQVLVNLLDNAAKYAPPSSTITIRARRSEGVVRLQVIDEGPGIPQDQLDLIFEKFHRVKDRDHQRAGTGLGLAICRGFVAAMGGTIKAVNRADRSGALFTVELPIISAREEKREAVA
jgi:two-component system sensor histidine kinase KdpD